MDHRSETTMHEVEVEFVKTENTIKREKFKQERNQPNVYLEMIQSFLNTVRLLAKRSLPHNAREGEKR